eukprot:gene8466-4910_t
MGNKVVPLENDKVDASSGSPVDVSQDSNFSLKHSSEIEGFGDGNTHEKDQQAVSFPGRTTVAWGGPLKREELVGLTVPRTVTHVPFLQLPEQTLMQMLGEGFPDPKTSHWTSNFHGTHLMNVTMPSANQDNFLRTRNQLFNMLVRAVVASARWQRLAAEWQVKSWDKTRVAVEHNVALFQRSGVSVSSQVAKSIATASTESFPSFPPPTPSPRLTDLEAAIKVVEQDHPMTWHSSMDPAIPQIDPNLAGLWPDMMKLLVGEVLHPWRIMSLTSVDSEIQSSESGARSMLSSSVVQRFRSSHDGGRQSTSSPRTDADLS